MSSKSTVTQNNATQMNENEDLNKKLAFWKSVENKYEKRNMELEEKKCTLQHRLDGMSCSTPTALFYSMVKRETNQKELAKYVASSAKPRNSRLPSIPEISLCRNRPGNGKGMSNTNNFKYVTAGHNICQCVPSCFARYQTQQEKNRIFSNSNYSCQLHKTAGPEMHINCTIAESQQKNQNSKFEKISECLTTENRKIAEQIKAVKLELQHCMERVENPLRSQLEDRRLKFEELQNDLRLVSSVLENKEMSRAQDTNSLKTQLNCSCRNFKALIDTNKQLNQALCGLQCKYQELQQNIERQKIISEVHAKEKLHEALCINQAMGDHKEVGQKRSSEDFEDDNLEELARKLSKTLLDIEKCNKCKKQLPEDLKDTVRGIKQLLNLIYQNNLKQKKRIISPTSASAAARKPGYDLKITQSTTTSLRSKIDVSIQRSNGSLSIDGETETDIRISSSVQSVKQLSRTSIEAEIEISIEKRTSSVSIEKLTPVKSLSLTQLKQTFKYGSSPALDHKRLSIAKPISRAHSAMETLEVFEKPQKKIETVYSPMTTLEENEVLDREGGGEERQKQEKKVEGSYTAIAVLEKNKVPEEEVEVEERETQQKEVEGSYTAIAVLEENKVPEEEVEVEERETQQKEVEGSYTAMATSKEYYGELEEETKEAEKEKESEEVVVEVAPIEEAVSDVEVEVEVDQYEEIDENINVISTIIKSGNLEVITESPITLIESVLTHTESGNINISTEVIKYVDEDLENFASESELEMSVSSSSRITISSTSQLADESSFVSEFTFVGKHALEGTGSPAKSLSPSDSTSKDKKSSSFESDFTFIGQYLDVRSEDTGYPATSLSPSDSRTGKESSSEIVSESKISSATGESESVSSTKTEEIESIIERESKVLEIVVEIEEEEEEEGKEEVEEVEEEEESEKLESKQLKTEAVFESAIKEPTEKLEIILEIEEVFATEGEAAIEAEEQTECKVEIEERDATSETTKTDTEASSALLSAIDCHEFKQLASITAEKQTEPEVAIEERDAISVTTKTDTEASSELLSAIDCHEFKQLASIVAEKQTEPEVAIEERDAISETTKNSTESSLDLLSAIECPVYLSTITLETTNFEVEFQEITSMEAENQTKPKVEIEERDEVHPETEVSSELLSANECPRLSPITPETTSFKIEIEPVSAEAVPALTTVKSAKELKIAVETSYEKKSEVQLEIIQEKESSKADEISKRESIDEEPFTVEDSGAEDLQKNVQEALDRASKLVMDALQETNLNVAEALEKAYKNLESVLTPQVKETTSKANKQVATEEDLLMHPSILESVPRGCESKMVPLRVSVTRQPEEYINIEVEKEEGEPKEPTAEKENLRDIKEYDEGYQYISPERCSSWPIERSPSLGVEYFGRLFQEDENIDIPRISVFGPKARRSVGNVCNDVCGRLYRKKVERAEKDGTMAEEESEDETNFICETQWKVFTEESKQTEQTLSSKTREEYGEELELDFAITDTVSSNVIMFPPLVEDISTAVSEEKYEEKTAPLSIADVIQDEAALQSLFPERITKEEVIQDEVPFSFSISDTVAQAEESEQKVPSLQSEIEQQIEGIQESLNNADLLGADESRSARKSQESRKSRRSRDSRRSRESRRTSERKELEAGESRKHDQEPKQEKLASFEEIECKDVCRQSMTTEQASSRKRSKSSPDKKRESQSSRRASRKSSTKSSHRKSERLDAMEVTEGKSKSLQQVPHLSISKPIETEDHRADQRADIKCECKECECDICASEKMKEKEERRKPVKIGKPDDCTCLPDCDCAVCSSPISKVVEGIKPSGDGTDQQLQSTKEISVVHSKTSYAEERKEEKHPSGCECLECICNPRDSSKHITEHPEQCDCLFCRCCSCPSGPKGKTKNEISLPECLYEQLCVKEVSSVTTETIQTLALSDVVSDTQTPLESLSKKLSIVRIPCSSTDSRGSKNLNSDVEYISLAHKSSSHPPNCDCFDCLYTASSATYKTVSSKEDSKLLHPENCNCSQCLQKAGLTSADQTLTNNIMNINSLETEIKNQKQTIAELGEVIKQVGCACHVAEFKAIEDTPLAKSFVAMQKSSFRITMSGLKLALSTLQDKCKKKDQMIATMTNELKLRTDSNIFDDLLGKLSTKNIDDIPVDYDRTEICNSLPRPLCDPQYGVPSNQLKEPLECRPCSHPDYPNCPCKIVNKKAPEPVVIVKETIVDEPEQPSNNEVIVPAETFQACSQLDYSKEGEEGEVSSPSLNENELECPKPTNILFFPYRIKRKFTKNVNPQLHRQSEQGLSHSKQTKTAEVSRTKAAAIPLASKCNHHHTSNTPSPAKCQKTGKQPCPKHGLNPKHTTYPQTLDSRKVNQTSTIKELIKVQQASHQQPRHDTSCACPKHGHKRTHSVEKQNSVPYQQKKKLATFKNCCCQKHTETQPSDEENRSFVGKTRSCAGKALICSEYGERIICYLQGHPQ